MQSRPLFGKIEQAIQVYSTVIQNTPDFAEAYNNRGLLYLQTGNRTQAKADFEKALEHKPDYVAARYNLGLATAGAK